MDNAFFIEIKNKLAGQNITLGFSEIYEKHSKRASFEAGRNAANVALNKYFNTCENYIVETKQTGEPDFSKIGNVFGSISHAGDFAVAVVYDKCIGLDLFYKHRKYAKDKLIKKIAMDEEEALIPFEIIFAVKEAFYKFYNPQINKYIGFKEVKIFDEEKDLKKLKIKYNGDFIKCCISVFQNSDYIVSIVYKNY